MSKIERSNSHGRFSEAEIRAGVAETKRQKSQPGYEKREAQRRAEAERRAQGRGTRFPDIAKRGGTRPITTPLAEVRDAAARFGLKPAAPAPPKSPSIPCPRRGFN